MAVRGSVVNMSCSTREFGKCVKTQLQLVCSNYGPGEFITISLLIKRDFRIWINTARKDPRQGGRRVSAGRRAAPGQSQGRALHPRGLPLRWPAAGSGSVPLGAGLCPSAHRPGWWFWTCSSVNLKNNSKKTQTTTPETTLGVKTGIQPEKSAPTKVKEHR